MRINGAFKMAGVLLALALALTLFSADAQAYSVKQSWARISASCGETITTGQAVIIADADGLAYKADANDATLRPAVGVAGKGCTSGNNVEIITQGIMTGWTALTESGNGYLSETAGAITQVAPAYSQQLGTAISTTDYYINAQGYFDTSSLTALGADVTVTGTTPTLTIGDTGDEDAVLIFDGQAADDFFIGFDTTDDDLHIGYGTTPGTQDAITITDSATPGVSIINAFDTQGATTFGNAVTDSITITGAIQGSSPFVLDGTTDNANELTVTLGADPGADYTLTVPATSSAAVMISALTTNDVDVANSIWGISNGLAMGGATGADGFELQIKPMGDPGADKIVYVPVLTDAAAMISSLTTNDIDVANSIWGVSNGLAFGGATGADGFEVTLSPSADPGADVAIGLPASSGTLANTAGLGSVKTVTAGSGTTTVTAADCGKVFTAAADADGVFNMPNIAATNKGCEITFINIGADTNNLLTINPDDSDTIHCVSLSNAAAAVDIEGSAGDAISNTKATAEKGDNLTLISDGTSAWYCKGFAVGIWADIN